MQHELATPCRVPSRRWPISESCVDGLGVDDAPDSENESMDALALSPAKAVIVKTLLEGAFITSPRQSSEQHSYTANNQVIFYTKSIQFDTLN